MATTDDRRSKSAAYHLIARQLAGRLHLGENSQEGGYSKNNQPKKDKSSCRTPNNPRHLCLTPNERQSLPINLLAFQFNDPDVGSLDIAKYLNNIIQQTLNRPTI